MAGRDSTTVHTPPPGGQGGELEPNRIPASGATVRAELARAMAEPAAGPPVAVLRAARAGPT